MLRVAEDALTLCYSQRAEPSRPRIYVLKEMMMNRTVVACAKPPEGERFLPALGSDRRLETVEVGLVSNVGNVLENARAGINRDRASRRTYPESDGRLGVSLDDGTPALLGRKAVLIEFFEVTDHPVGKAHSFHGADLSELRAP